MLTRESKALFSLVTLTIGARIQLSIIEFSCSLLLMMMMNDSGDNDG